MPSEQTCGDDGLIVGILCYGIGCQQIQLVCRTIGANVTWTSTPGALTAVGTTDAAISTQSSQGLYVNPKSWSSPPAAGQPSQLQWDGSKASSPSSSTGITVSAAPKLSITSIMAVLVLAVGCKSH